MSAIQAVQRRVFYSPTANRHFFSKRAAAKREASAMMNRKYPRGDDDKDWSEIEQFQNVHSRLARMIMRGLR